MPRVICRIEEVELENDRGYLVEGVCSTCTRCGHETESFGTSDASIRRCLVLLREECPKREKNFYTVDEPEPKVEAVEEEVKDEDFLAGGGQFACCNPECDNVARYRIADMEDIGSPVDMCLECTKLFILKEVEDAEAQSR